MFSHTNAYLSSTDNNNNNQSYNRLPPFTSSDNMSSSGDPNAAAPHVHGPQEAHSNTAIVLGGVVGLAGSGSSPQQDMLGGVGTRRVTIGGGGGGGSATVNNAHRSSLGFDAAALSDLFSAGAAAHANANAQSHRMSSAGFGTAELANMSNHNNNNNSNNMVGLANNINMGGMGGGSGHRRPSGFADLDILTGRRDSMLGGGGGGGGLGRRDSLLGGGMGRRDSLDSTTAVLDAAIFDMTRRRLSMAVGSMPPGNDMNNMGMNMNNMGMAGMNNMGMNMGMGMNMNDSMMGMGGMNHPMGGVGMHPMGNNSAIGGMNSMGMGAPANQFLSAPMSINSFQAGGVGASHNMNMAMTMPPTQSSVNARQDQLQEQQLELELRQKELEIQRQQIMAGIEDRRMAMQQMQHQLQHQQVSVNVNSGMMEFTTQQRQNGRNHAMLMSQLAAGAGSTAPDTASQAAAASSTQTQTVGGNGTAGANGAGAGANGWWVCQICNSKAFMSREAAMEHESCCGAFARNVTAHDFAHMEKRGIPHEPHASLQPNLNNRSGSLGGGNNNNNNDIMNDHSSQHLTGVAAASSAAAAAAHRRFSISRDHADITTGTDVERILSTGPFGTMDTPLPLAMEFDKDWLTPLHCFVRRNCVQVFSATDKDVATPSKGKRKPIQVGQIGIRCPHCHQDEGAARERGSVYYPTTIASIYNATMNLLQRHLHSCSSVPQEIMRRYETLKADDARSGTSKKYWVESANSLGLVDTAIGIRFSALPPPPLPSLSRQQTSDHALNSRRNSNDFFSSNSNAISDLSMQSDGGVMDASGRSDGHPANNNDNADLLRKLEVNQLHNPSSASQPASAFMAHHNQAAGAGGIHQMEQSMAQSITQSAPLVTPDDEPYSTSFSFHLLGQMQRCVFTEADRLGKRKGLPPGFPGLACRHCFGGYGSGRFFPSSIKTLSDTSKTLNVLHNHMMRCRKCPTEVRDALEGLRASHDEERAKMKFGSQKAFFARIWDRLHGNTVNTSSAPANSLKRKLQGRKFPAAESKAARAAREKSKTTGLDPRLSAKLLSMPSAPNGPVSSGGGGGMMDGIIMQQSPKRPRPS
jgi:hypothetical protein